jgi:phospholipid/cholesterol/gamma-HCH transport system substrate-binding protein
MGVNPETKVGILSAFALLALCSLFFWLNRVTFLQKGSEAEVIFDRIEGLRPGAPVKYIGVDVGRIKKIYFEKQHIIVMVHINQGFELPYTSKAMIASSGVIGDKYLELQPLRPGERPLANHRIQGEAPTSMEQLYASAFEIMKSLQQTVDSLNRIVADQDTTASLKNILANLEKVSATAERLVSGNETAINRLIHNAETTSAELARASATVNRFLQTAADGRAAADLKTTLVHINTVSANLDRFSRLLAEKGPQLLELTDDAHQTMAAITEAAHSLSIVVKSFNSGTDGQLTNLQQTLVQAGNAAQTVSAYVNNFAKITTSQQVGVGYQSSKDVTVNYRLGLNLSEQQILDFELTDIGYENLGTLQFKLKNPGYSTRVGIYRNQVGFGVDWAPWQNYSIGVDLWDTHSANLGLSTTWRINSDWSMTASTAWELENGDHRWDLGWWRRF